MFKNNKTDTSQQTYRVALRLSAQLSSIHREHIPKRTIIEIIMRTSFGIKGWILYTIAIVYLRYVI